MKVKASRHNKDAVNDEEEEEDTGGVVRDTTLAAKGGGRDTKFSAMKMTGLCPVVLLVKVG